MHVAAFSVPDRVAAQAAAAPRSVAVTDQYGGLTYENLIDQADRVAHHLLSHGTSPGDIIGVCLDRDATLVTTLLGVLRAGCAYLPLDPAYPVERLGFMVRDCQASAVVTTPQRLADLPVGGASPIDISAALSHVDEGWAGTELPGIDPDALAYVIYTSGSTGSPNGVAVEHRQLSRLFDAVNERIPVNGADVWSWFHSVAFDFSVWEIWGALSTGGRLVAVSTQEARDPAAFLARLRRSATTILSQTPSAFHNLLPLLDTRDVLNTREVSGTRELSSTHEMSGTHDRRGVHDLAWSVRAVILGGESINIDAMASLLNGSTDPPRLYNLYGITETTVHTTIKELTSADLHSGVRSPIGTPLADVRLAVLDADRRPVEVGQEGELWVGGAGVCRGYVGRPQLTAQRFVTALLSEQPGMRWHRTGDRARQLPSGEYEYLGRIDRQVKIRGHRIELGDVEAACATHPAVSAVSVRARSQQLVAYLVVTGVDQPSVDEMRAWLARRLPDFMIPASFIRLDRLPLTVNGKVDMLALDQAQGAGLPRRTGIDRPGTPTQATLTAIWANILGHANIGSSDNFFALGGDSMVALRIVAACTGAGLPVAVSDIFANPTVSGLATYLDSRRLDATAGVPTNVATGTIATPAASVGEAPATAAAGGRGGALLIPASQMQRMMLFESARSPEAGTYHVVSAIRLTGLRTTSESRVRAALSRLCVANIALRTSFDFIHFRQPMQVVPDNARPHLDYVDVSGEPDEGQRRLVDEVFAEQRRRRFTERDGPLWRFVFIKVSEDAAEAMLVHHHAILDGWSVARFFDQFVAALDGQVHPCPAPGIHEEAIRLEQQAVRDGHAAEFWRAQLADWRPLPTAGPSRSQPARQRVPVFARIDDQLYDAIRNVARGWQCAAKHIFLAAHLRAVATFARWEDYAATAMVVNCRPELAGAHDALGVFLNVVPLALSGIGRSWEQVARAAMAADQRLQPHRWYPQATMVTKLGMPAANVCFNYTEFSSTAMHSYHARVTEFSPNSMALTVSVVDTGLIIEADPALIGPDDRENLLEWHIRHLAEAVAEAGPIGRT